MYLAILGSALVAEQAQPRDFLDDLGTARVVRLQHRKLTGETIHARR